MDFVCCCIFFLKKDEPNYSFTKEGFYDNLSEIFNNIKLCLNVANYNATVRDRQGVRQDIQRARALWCREINIISTKVNTDIGCGEIILQHITAVAKGDALC